MRDVIQHRREVAFCLVFGLSLLLYELFDRYALIDPPPLLWGAFGIIFGALIGIRASYLLSLSSDRQGLSLFRRTAAIISAPLLLAGAGYSSALKIYEVMHFAFYEPELTTIVATVRRKNWTKLGIAQATVVPNGGSREITVDVARDLWTELNPYRAPGHDCLVFTVQVGRGGVRRIVVPNVIDERVTWNSWAECYNQWRIDWLIKHWWA